MKTEHSAGGIVFKTQDGKTLWLIAKHSGYHKWAFPKGLIDPGETAETTAVREVREETGITANIITPIQEKESYFYTFNGEKISKTVQYYVMEYVSGNIADHDWEMEDVKWADEHEVQSLLGFEAAKKTFDRAVALHQ